MSSSAWALPWDPHMFRRIGATRAHYLSNAYWRLGLFAIQVKPAWIPPDWHALK